MFRTICATSGQRIISATQTPKRIIRKKKSLYRTPTMEKISPEPPKKKQKEKKKAEAKPKPVQKEKPANDGQLSLLDLGMTKAG